jgi:hypothetical protein
VILDDPLAGRAMARGVRTVGLGLATAWWVASLVAILTGPRFASATFQDGALVVLAIPLAWSLSALRSLNGPVKELQVFVIMGLVIRLVEPFVAFQPQGTVDYSPLMPVLTASAALVGFVITPRWGIPMIAAHAGVILSRRVAVVGWVQSTAEAVDFLVSDLIIMIVIWALREGLDRVALATAGALDAETRATSARHRAMIRQRLDGLVHDKVLAALTLAPRGLDAEAAGLARDALTELAPEPGGPRTTSVPDSLAVISEHAHLLGIDLTLDADAWPSGPEGDALRAATCEALTNVLRHSGVRHAEIRTSQRDRFFVVEVIDDGVGFDVATIPTDRIGVKERIVGGLAAVGARADIKSRTGQGTRITMTASVTPDDPVRTPSRLPRAMWWALPLAAVSVGAHIAIGALHLSHVYSRGVVVFGFVAIPVLGVVVATVRNRWPRWYIALGASVLTWAVLLANVRDPFVSDWRTWFIGSLSGLAAIVAWRRGMWHGLAVIVLGTGLGIVGLELRGETSWAPVIMATVQGVVYTPAVAWIRSVIDRAGVRTTRQLRIAADAEVETSLAEALEEQIAARRTAMDVDTIPLLRSIASGETLNADQRARCREVEASTRDQLVAPTLLSRELVSAIGTARARGCRVRISGEATPGPVLDGFRAAALALLLLTRPDDRVTLRASTDGTATHGTAVLVGTDAAALPLPVLPALCTVADISRDPDSILVEVGPGGSVSR